MMKCVTCDREGISALQKYVASTSIPVICVLCGQKFFIKYTDSIRAGSDPSATLGSDPSATLGSDPALRGQGAAMPWAMSQSMRRSIQVSLGRPWRFMPKPWPPSA